MTHHRAPANASPSTTRPPGIRLTAVAAAGALVAVALLSGPSASADPRLGSARTYAGVGSAATSGLWDGLTNGRPVIDNSRVIVPTVASYNTAGSDQIRTRTDGPLFARPHTNYDGAYALSASNHAPFLADATGSSAGAPRVAIEGQVDFSRESFIDPRFPGTDLTYLPFARDAISVVGWNLDPDLTNFTREELTAIYTCTSAGNITVTNNGGHATIYYDNGTTVRQRLFPKLPEGTGDVRDFFSRAVGFSGTSWCVNVSYPHTWPENDGSAIRSTGEIMPFLVSAWIAQKHLEVPTTVWDRSLRITSINGVAPLSGYGTSLLPGPLFGRSADVPVPGRGIFWRDVYNAIDSSDVGTPLEATLTTQVGTPLARYAINRFGFKNIDYLGDRSRYRTGGYHN